MLIDEKIRQYIPAFTLEKLYDLIELTLKNRREDGVFMSFVFDYAEPESTDFYQIKIDFSNCRFNNSFSFDLSEILDINLLEFIDISGDGWEETRWHVRNIDDDDTRLFEFYCGDIDLGFIKSGADILYVRNDEA